MSDQMDEIWEIKKRTQGKIIDQLLVNRNIELTEEAKRRFFEPDFRLDLHDPFLMNGIKEAALRIKAAVEKGESVGVFADYDADGIPGAAVMYRALNEIGLNVFTYIPDREGGYGLSQTGIDHLVSKGCTLIISIDLGIKNFEEAIYCQQKLDIDLIITDHHLPDEDLPKAMVVINPKTGGNKYPYPDLCGCGVAYKLVTALSKYYPTKITEAFLKWNLDLVAISTIADVVPLTGENRVLAKYGLLVLRKTKNTGLRELIRASGIKIDQIDAYTTGFQIGPRINAPGRMASATKSFELLITDDIKEAGKLAQWLNEQNEHRQREMDAVIKEAISNIEKDSLLSKNLIIVAGNWIKGIIGPSASKICELFSRPVILFAFDGGKYTGSARSIEGINIVELIGSAESYVERYGGHKGAAGLTVEEEKFNKFKKMVLSYAQKNISKSALSKKIKIDTIVDSKELNLKLLEEISRFEPFGMGNTRPLFLLSGVKLSYIKSIGRENNHLSFTVNKDEQKMRAVSFNYKKSLTLSPQGVYDIVFSITLNEWNNQKNINLNVVTIREHEVE